MARFGADMARIDADRAARPLLMYVSCQSRSEKRETLSAIERSIASGVKDKLIKKLGALYAGYIEIDAQMQYYFYIHDAEEFERGETIAEKTPLMDCTAGLADEPDWLTYKTLLYPDAAKLQTELNRDHIAHNGLHHFSFNLESGQLVAIMGGSGVGKSTLLGIMNGNIRPDKGMITVNGHPLDSPDARQLIGFVPQDDLLIEELTVYQNLLYTARLCFARLTDEEIGQRVEKVLKELDLEEIKGLEVGSPIRKTISGGQRKRLNIALELIREPAILYLDEPTSGLSSSDSEKVIMLLKEQTHRGKLVVVNIHQPSSEIYKLFDCLWLLDRGGYPIYDGNPIEAITYFKQAAKYTDPDISVCSVCGNVNPELILNIIDSKKIDDSGNQTNIRKFTPEEWHAEYLASRPAFSPVEEEALPKNQQKKPSWFKQFLIFLERNIRTKLTNKQYLTITLLEAPLLALIVALLTRYMDGDEYTLLANKNFVSYIFMSVKRYVLSRIVFVNIGDIFSIYGMLYSSSSGLQSY